MATVYLKRFRSAGEAVAAWTAPCRHQRMHSPQSMHSSGSASAHPSRTRMAPVGQALQQSTQPTQRWASKTIECSRGRRPPSGTSREPDGIGERRADPGGRLHTELVRAVLDVGKAESGSEAARARISGVAVDQPGVIASAMSGIPWPRSATTTRIASGRTRKLRSASSAYMMTFISASKLAMESRRIRSGRIPRSLQIDLMRVATSPPCSKSPPADPERLGEKRLAHGAGRPSLVEAERPARCRRPQTSYIVRSVDSRGRPRPRASASTGPSGRLPLT